MFSYEVILAYIFLFSMASAYFISTHNMHLLVYKDIFTNIFGGADVNEGLGLFSLNFDGQYIGPGSVSCACDISMHIDPNLSTGTRAFL